ncbi:TPA: HNH endonuclease, partial [Neisseria meningitidis]
MRTEFFKNPTPALSTVAPWSKRQTATKPSPVSESATAEKGESKIPDYTWHHHQDAGRMQLVPEEKHSPTGHIGSRAM